MALPNVVENSEERPSGWRFDEVVMIASHLAGRGVNGAIHVVVNERPGYHDLLHLRGMAESNGLTLTVTADGVVFLAKALSVPSPEEECRVFWEEVEAVRRRIGGAWHAVRARFAAGADGPREAPALNWLLTHVVAWNAGFTGLNEGTR